MKTVWIRVSVLCEVDIPEEDEPFSDKNMDVIDDYEGSVLDYVHMLSGVLYTESSGWDYA
jgi:hypothetical protein